MHTGGFGPATCRTFLALHIILFLCFSFATADCPTGLVAHWGFDEQANPGKETVGLPAGVVSGATWLQTGKVGGALDFDGTDDSVDIATGVDISGKSFTVTAWAKRDSTGSVNLILSQGDAQLDKGLAFGFRASNEFMCSFWGDDLDTLPPYTDTDWHHWACTYDSTTKARKIYRDGAQVASDTAANHYYGSGAAKIGDREFGGANLFPGLIDEVAVFERALSKDDIQALIDKNLLGLDLCADDPVCGNGEIEGAEECDDGNTVNKDGCTTDCTLEQAVCGQGHTADIVGYWGFDVAGAPGEDIVGGHHGTVSGATTTTSGKVGSAMQFARTGQRITIPDGPATDATGALTISAWIKRSAITPAIIATKYFPPLAVSAYHFTVSPTEDILLSINPHQCKRYSGVTVNDGQWHHIVGVFEPGLSQDVYVDGELINGNLEGTMQTAITTNDKDLLVGDLLDGTMDEFAMFHRALSANDVKLLYAAGRAGKSFCTVPVCGNAIVEGDEECDSSDPVACKPDCTLNLPTCGEGVTQGLVSYWSFDDPKASGRDEFGTNYGQVSGAVPVSGRSGVGMEFDGLGSVVTVPKDPSLDITNAITLSAWIRADAWGAEAWSSTIVGNDEELSGAPKGYCLRVGGNGILSFVQAHVSSWPETRTPAGGMSVGTWHHVAGTFDGTMLRAYVDGVERSSFGITPSTLYVSASSLGIGRGTSALTQDRAFDGRIDEVAIFDEALTGDEVKHLYLAGRAHKPFCTQDLPPGLPDGFMPALDRSGALPCPDDMATITAYWGSYCIDRWEASKVGVDVAQSAPGETPWYSATPADAKAACEKAGKRLCTDAEWMAACNLQGQKYYLTEEESDETYGCNTYSVENEILPTGSRPACRTNADVYDMIGNVWEFVDDEVPVATWQGTNDFVGFKIGYDSDMYGGDKVWHDQASPGNVFHRGGNRYSSTVASPTRGCFALYLNPMSGISASGGFRCCSGDALSPSVPAILEEALVDRNQKYLDTFNEGVDLVRQGHPELAVSKFQECLVMAPSNVFVSTNIAVLQQGQGPTCAAPLAACHDPPVCVDLSTDVNNCGQCGNVCQVMKGTPACLPPGGICGIQVCDPGYGDCDEQYTTGCEAKLNTIQNCYNCGSTCTGGKECLAGGCGCPTGKTDCLTLCADTQSDPGNCGACGNVCDAGQVCAQGQCSSECSVATTECEGACVDVSTDADNCGACGTKCSAVMGSAKCASGLCGITSCTDGYGDCDKDYSNGCEAPLSTDNNCGACSTTCTGGKSCKSGSCQCPTGSTDCNGDCVNLQTDGKHCGKCSNVCPSGQLCANGECSTECPAGTTACGTACVNLLTDVGNCGVCDTVCPEGRTCLTGNCTCPGSNTECAGACVDILIDANNCGGCGSSCTTPNAQTSCSTGVCTIALCTAGYGDCDLDATTGCETALSTSDNCGGCGTTCTGGMACVEGACACSSGRTDCEGTCVDIQSNPAHCGACGTICPEGQVCASGSCSTECPAGTTACAGACVDIATDVENCGTCGTACSVVGGTAECKAGVCAVGTCDTGFGDCDSIIATGCETELGGNNAHCGKCGNACNEGEACDGGECKRTTNRGNGEPCERPDDCASSNCVNKVCCVAGKSCCTSDADCLENEACDTARFYCIKMAVTPPPDALAGEELREEAAEQLDQAMKLIEELKEKAPDLDTSTIETLLTEAQQKLDANDFSAAYKVALDAVKQAEDEKKKVKYTIGQECAADEECKTGNCGNGVCCMAGKVCCTKPGQCDVGESCEVERNYCVPEEKEERPLTARERVLDILSSPEQLLTIVAAIVGGVGFGLYQIVSNIQDKKEKKKLEAMQQQWQAQQQQQFYGGPGGQWQAPGGYQQSQQYQQWGQQPGGQQWGRPPGQ